VDIARVVELTEVSYRTDTLAYTRPQSLYKMQKIRESETETDIPADGGKRRFTV